MDNGRPGHEGLVARITRLPDHAGWTLLIFVGLSLLMNGWYLFGGFAADDLLFLNVVEQDPLPYDRWRGMWSFKPVDCFEHLWWGEPGAIGYFWRPVFSLLFEASVRVFGHNAFPLHLVSVTVHGAVAAGLVVLTRRTGLSGLVAVLAGLVFVTCEDHSMGVGWIATQTDLLCAGFFVLAMLAHRHWLEHRRAPALVGSLASLALAFGCKESAATAPLVLVAMSFFLPRGRVEGELSWGAIPGRLGHLMRDWTGWLPQLALLALYLGMYTGLELGGMNNLMYVDPFSKPGLFLKNALVNAPILWLASLSPAWASFTMFMPELVPIYVVGGIAALLTWLWALWPWRRHPLSWWAMGMYLLVMAPQLGTEASERALYFPMLFGGILLAQVAARVRFLARRTGAPERTPLWTRLCGWWVLGGMVVLGLITSAVLPWSMRDSLSAPEREISTALPYVDDPGAQRILLLNTSGMFATYYPGDTLRYLLDRPVNLWVLSSAHGTWTLERGEGDRFVIRTDRPGWISNMFARVVRVDPELEPGAVYDEGIFTATLLELTDDHRDTLAVRFDLAHPIDDPDWLFLTWNGEAYVPLDLAALPPGERIPLVDNTDLWATMM